MAATIRQCQRCRSVKVTSEVTFKANVSFLFRRDREKFSGYLCLSCITKEFLSFELTTLFGTWWGIIGCILGPVFIVYNIIEYIEGSVAIVAAKRRFRREGRTVRQNTLETHVTTKTTPDYVGVGKSFGEIFVKPNVWRDINKLRGYQAPDLVANYELAFARVAIIRETIKRQKAGLMAAHMLNGIDNYISDAFNKRCEQEVSDYYSQIPLNIVALSAIYSYEFNVFPLTSLAFIFARRLSIVSVPVTEIAALFDEVKTEAETLLRFSTGLQR